MEHSEVLTSEVHTPPHLQARISGERRNSPIFVPAVRGPVKMVKRGARHRRRVLLAVAGLMILVLAAFAYAFVVERDREKTVRLQTE